jgi:hypothetical protein
MSIMTVDDARLPSPGHGSVCESESQGANVVSHHAVGHVDVSDIIGAQFARIRRSSGDHLDFFKKYI